MSEMFLLKKTLNLKTIIETSKWNVNRKLPAGGALCRAAQGGKAQLFDCCFFVERSWRSAEKVKTTVSAA